MTARKDDDMLADLEPGVNDDEKEFAQQSAMLQNIIDIETKPESSLPVKGMYQRERDKKQSAPKKSLTSTNKSIDEITTENKAKQA